MNYRIIWKYIGIILVFMSIMMVSVVFVGWIYNEYDSMLSYTGAIILTMSVGGVLVWIGKSADSTLYRREAITIVSLTWFFIGFFGGLGLFFDGVFNNLYDSFFEAVSGFTTTGASVLSDIEAISYSSKFWRSMTNWLGGLGIIALFVAIFPQLGVGGKHLFQSEMAGPINEGLKPKIKETSLILWKIYIGLTLLFSLILWMADLSYFDALNHSMTAIATGGFSTYNNSVSGLQNPLVEYILCVFMMIGATNFGLIYFTLRGNYLALPKNPEFRVFVCLMLVITMLVFIGIVHTKPDTEEAFRMALFQTISIITTTGFGTDNYELWPYFPKLLIGFVFIFGGMAGSTAGGAKIIRLMIMFKVIIAELSTEFRPQMIRLVKVGKNVINSDVAKSVMTFFVITIIFFVINSLFLAALGVDGETAMGSTYSALFNIGPGFGETNPSKNYSIIPDAGKISLSILMILGRLEFITVLTLLVPAFWKR